MFKNRRASAQGIAHVSVILQRLPGEFVHEIRIWMFAVHNRSYWHLSARAVRRENRVFTGPAFLGQSVDRWREVRGFTAFGRLRIRLKIPSRPTDRE